MEIYKRPGAKFYTCRFTVYKRRIMRSTGCTTKREAQAWGEKLRSELLSDGDMADGTLHRCMQLDLARCVEQAMESREKTLRVHWTNLTDCLGKSRRCHTLKGSDISEYIQLRRKEGASTSTIKRELGTLKRGLELGRDEGWLVHMPRFPSVGRHVVGEAKRGRAWPVEQLVEWMGHLSGEALALAAVTLSTGLRRTEVERLCLSWVEGEGDESGLGARVRVPASAAKNRQERVVGIASYALSKLRACAVERGVSPHEPVFTGIDPRYAWARAAKAAGIEGRVSFRDLRTTHMTVAMAATQDAAAVQAAAGHSDLAVTQLYQRSTVARQVAAATAVSEMLPSE